MAIAIRLPELSSADQLIVWSQNLIRTVSQWTVLRPTISTGTVTFSVNPATTATTIIDRNATPSSFVALTPTNANGAGTLGVGWYVSSLPGGSAVITHQGSSLTRTYSYIIVG